MQILLYINEDLPKALRDIFKYARDLKRGGFKYVWCRNGHVYVRKEDVGAVVKIELYS
ncbi:unnamed protein product [Acanthoscelides obtectus]|uniref:FP protein C-terminal domain-containing protein n=1 Tax=Acanthoscelides obtectus TaxID=200917 RepID=A0A9P0KL91_ACAOB|nr:unnamed protein product [Acanthoscelides obtectus]CAK1623666.1 hypothetical protein AOBTE_LOCUS2115 [Acanthoscelides obtectus]